MAMSLRWVLDARLGAELVDLVSFPFEVHRPHSMLQALDVPGFFGLMGGGLCFKAVTWLDQMPRLVN
jgi:hypothetical protein